MDWKVSTSKASEERPNERYVRFQNSSADLSSIDLSDPEFPVFNFEGDSGMTHWSIILVILKMHKNTLKKKIAV